MQQRCFCRSEISDVDCLWGPSWNRKINNCANARYRNWRSLAENRFDRAGNSRLGGRFRHPRRRRLSRRLRDHGGQSPARADRIGDSVNAWMLTRNARRDAGLRAGARVVEVEIICSDINEHRRRVENRSSEVPGLILPIWAETIHRDYHHWDREHVVIDTAERTVAECASLILSAL